MPIMVSTVLYLACLSALQLPLSSAQKITTTTTVPILDWGFDFPGSAISVIGQTSGSTTYRLTCNSPGECQWTQVPDRASYLNNMVGTMTFIEAGAPYNAAMTLNISARGIAFSYQATCTPRTKPITIQTTDSEGRFTDFPVRAPNLVDCTSTSMGKEPTPTFELDGTTGVYKMVVITQGVEKLDLGAAPTGLITTGGVYDSRDECEYLILLQKRTGEDELMLFVYQLLVHLLRRRFHLQRAQRTLQRPTRKLQTLLGVSLSLPALGWQVLLCS